MRSAKFPLYQQPGLGRVCGLGLGAQHCYIKIFTVVWILVYINVNIAVL